MNSDRFNFRVWEPLNKKMHYMEFCLRKDVKYYALQGDQEMRNAYCIMNLDSLEVMQSTTKKDKINQLMYESDIVIYAEHGDWDQANYGDAQGNKPLPEVIKWNPDNLALGPDGYPFGGNPEWYKVIGNIHEDSHLLIEGKES